MNPHSTSVVRIYSGIVVHRLQDWNVFLENFADLEFCITGNNTDVQTTAAPQTSQPTPKTTSKPTSTVATATSKDTTTGQVLEHDGPRCVDLVGGFGDSYSRDQRPNLLKFLTQETAFEADRALFHFVISRNYSVSLLLTIQPTKDFLAIPHNITSLSGSVFGHQLGLTGSAAQEPVNITTELAVEWNATHCNGPPYGCQSVKILTCVHFQASPLVFPSSK